jgi:hypothetical protein
MLRKPGEQCLGYDGTVAIAPFFTFAYAFTVRECELRQPAELGASRPAICFSGQGGVRSSRFFESLAGPEPKFELFAGWLTLFPTMGWTNPVAFATRDIWKSWSIYVGEAMQYAMRVGDTLHYSRDLVGDFAYSVVRSSEVILRAGSIDGLDLGGPVAVWESREARRNPQLKEIREIMAARPSSANTVKGAKELRETLESSGRYFQVAEAHKVYVDVRVNDRVFHLVDRQNVYVDPYYVFVARTSSLIQSTDCPMRAVHSFGRIDTLANELIVKRDWRRWWKRRGYFDVKMLIRDAAEQLTAPKVRVV